MVSEQFLKKARTFNFNPELLDSDGSGRENFLKRWPLENLKNLTVKEYCGLTKDSFVYWLEFKKVLAGIGGGSSFKFGVYGKPSEGKYYKRDGGQAREINGTELENDFLRIRDQIIKVIGYAKSGKIDDIEGMERALASIVLLKIITIYAPEYFITVLSRKALVKAVTELGILPEDEAEEKTCIYLNFILNKKLNEIPETRGWTDSQKGIFIWDTFKDDDSESESGSHSARKEILRVGMYLSKYGDDYNSKRFPELGWGDIYKKFYPSLGNGKDITSFCNYLKNVRDMYDGHFENSRQGWKNEDGSPRTLDRAQQKVFNSFSGLSEEKFWKKIEKYLNQTDEIFEVDEESSGPCSVHPLNMILYGAPGTGKTYNSKKKALEILGIEFTDEDFLDQYEKARKDGLVSFVTFHPNFGYENFVEGIFPNVEAKEGLRYVEKTGIFKEISERALSDLISPVDRNQSILSFEEAYESFLDFLTEEGGQVEYSTLAQEKKFTVAESETGGLTFTTGSGTVLHCAEKKLKRIYEKLASNNITSPDRSDILDDRSLVAYTVVVLRKLFSFTKKDSVESKSSVHFDPYELIQSGKYTVNKNASRYVLIIDEINRGNIPSIFGELITLIEESKRLGRPEGTLVRLPMSMDVFGVPENLYLIGTMNTADRSVEALDVALRRRFSFQEMTPLNGSELLFDVEGIDLRKMLKTINDRIYVLKGKDYVIGYSYFLDVNSVSKLREVFRNKVIPLIEEYFFGEMHKVQMVLGKSFVKSKFSQDDLRRLKLPLDLDGGDVLNITNMDEWDFKSIYE